MNKIGFVVTTILVLLLVASSMLFVVDQRQFGVVYAFGQIKDVVKQPGLNFKLPPPFQNVSYLDKRLLTLTPQTAETMLTQDQKWIVVDWYVRWRITDPSPYIRNVGLDETAGAMQLSRVTKDALLSNVGKRSVRDLISTDREEVMAAVKREVLNRVQGASPWGVDIVDVRITRVDYVKSITESVYNRMRAERNREANELRATGFAEGEKIRADADRQRDVTVSNAYRDAQKVKGEGDAEAAAAYAAAFGRDPQFAKFYRSLDAYKAAFNKKSDVLVIDPASSDFFRALNSSGDVTKASGAAPARTASAPTPPVAGPTSPTAGAAPPAAEARPAVSARQ